MNDKAEPGVLETLKRAVYSKGAHYGPPPDFDEARYLELYPDVAVAIKEGKFASGFEHYLKHGRHENRGRPTIVDYEHSGGMSIP